MKNLTGQKFGKLTVLNYTEKREFGSIVWHCKCDCGNECDVRASSLTNGNTKSCGCLQSPDITGQKFGKLTVISRNKERKRGCITWHCQCECGNEIDVIGSSLKNGSTKSCGCIKSYGEYRIAQILKENNISFEKEKFFENCKNPNNNHFFKFDFYVNNEYLIEYDGIQHFDYKHTNSPGWNTKENFEKRQYYDSFKNQWCKDNNILLIRIPYNHLNDLCLKDLIPETSKFLME